MRTLATGCRNKPRGITGFTLIELLVVVVILAVILAAGTSLMQFGVNERRIEREGQRLASVMDFLCEQALLLNRAHGLAFSKNGYLAVQAPSRATAVMNGHASATTRSQVSRPWPEAALPGTTRNRWTLPDGVSLQLKTRQRPVHLKDKPANLPQVVCDANGRLTPFTVTFRSMNVPADYVIESLIPSRAHGGLPLASGSRRQPQTHEEKDKDDTQWVMHWQPRDQMQP